MYHYTKEQLLEFLTAYRITYDLYNHKPLFTCEEALEVIKELNIPGMGIKNLFLKDSKKRFYLISAAYTTQVNLKSVGKVLDAKELRFADTELLMSYLGVEPGSVTPLALINDKEQAVQVILDTELLKQDYIQVHPLKNDASVVMKPADLIKFLSTNNRSYVTYNFIENKII